MRPFKSYAVVTAYVVTFTLFLAACKKSSSGTPGNTSINKNKIAYVFKADSTDAKSYKTLMQANGCDVTLLDLPTAIITNYSKYDLIVIGNNAANEAYDFTTGMANYVASSGKPVLMIGAGGGHFGEMINTTVNWGTVSTYSFSPNMVVVDDSSPIYSTPKKITIPDNGQLPIFSHIPHGVAFIETSWNKKSTLEEIGQAGTAANNDFSITVENGKYGYFGYYDNVDAMTQTGKDFMVNLTYYVGRLSL